VILRPVVDAALARAGETRGAGADVERSSCRDLEQGRYADALAYMERASGSSSAFGSDSIQHDKAINSIETC
jgi:hypothetical protein